jgi:hypothetical protein
LGQKGLLAHTSIVLWGEKNPIDIRVVYALWQLENEYIRMPIQVEWLKNTD